jgi:glycosyltransferase involved in cell wall biosynthesis
VSAEPQLTCVLIFLDGERFIDEAIRSVVDQAGGEDWELLLVDDGSTDGSTAIAQRWAATDPRRIRYVDHAGHANLGMSASRNAGVEAARGRFVGFLDCDDVWLPCVLAHSRRVLAAHPRADVLIGGTWRWHGWTGSPEDRARDQIMSLPAVAPGVVVEPPDLFPAMYGTPGGWRIPAMCSLIVRRDALRAIGGMEAEFRGLYEDQVLYTKLALRLPAVVDRRPLALYRQHPDSACEQSITAGTWQRIGPSAPAAHFMAWMAAYVDDVAGPDSSCAAIVRHNIDHDGWWVEPPARRRWSRLRSAVPAPVRRLARRAVATPAEPGPSVLAAWGEQHLGAAAAVMTGRVLVAEPADGGRAPWVDAVPDGAFPPGALVERGALAAAAAAAFDHVVVPLGAADGLRPADVVAGVVAALRPGGGGAVMVRGAAPPAPPGVRCSVEPFGNRATAAAVAAGVEASAVGVDLDRHDPAAPVVSALTIGALG